MLSSGIDPSLHETDLLTQFAAKINGMPFGIVVAVTASVALIMAVNTAFVASSELIERVAHRYNFSWIIKTNVRQSLYRVHILNAVFYSCIIILTGGSQKILAEMYALGLVASFTINMGSLLIYRYSTGTKEIREYNTSRLGTLVVFIMLVCCLGYLAFTKPYGLALWLSATVFFLVIGFGWQNSVHPKTFRLPRPILPCKWSLGLQKPRVIPLISISNDRKKRGLSKTSRWHLLHSIRRVPGFHRACRPIIIVSRK